MQTRRPYFLQRKPSVQCSDRPNTGRGGIVGLKLVIAGGPDFFKREVVVVVFFQGRAQD